MRLVFFVLIAIVFLAFIRLTMVVAPAAGVFVKLEPTGLDQCRRVDIAPGTEDVDIDPDNSLAYVSASDRRAWYQKNEPGLSAQNGIYALSLDGSDRVRRVTPADFTDFFAHGISLWRGTDGNKRLFAINHLPQSDGSVKELVEIFDVEADGALTHVKSVSFPEMYSPNDIVAVGPDAFYATNDRRYDHGLMAQLELFLGLPLTGVVYWDGEQGRDVTGGLMYANGINKSADGSKIYVAEFLAQAVRVYDRDVATGALTPVKTLKTGTGPDNLAVSEDGAIWIGGHPKAFDFAAHAEDPAAISPSHVVRLDPETGERKDVLISTNGEINGSSVGALWDKTLIVGAVFDGHVLVCEGAG